uniref:Ovule protein n=1 Tax=Steinernema glaseri TaxID=37863 RepID=A0A1I7YHU1_9BILA
MVLHKAGWCIKIFAELFVASPIELKMSRSGCMQTMVLKPKRYGILNDLLLPSFLPGPNDQLNSFHSPITSSSCIMKVDAPPKTAPLPPIFLRSD